jgi:hypothetical protein
VSESPEEIPLDADLALALPREIVFRGRTIRFALWDTVDVIALYERYLREQVRRSLRTDSGILDPVEFENVLVRADRDLHSGWYKFGSPGFFNSLASLEHRKHLAWLEARHLDRDLPRTLIDEMWADRETRVQLEAILLPQGDVRKNGPSTGP